MTQVSPATFALAPETRSVSTLEASMGKILILAHPGSEAMETFSILEPGALET